MRFITIFLPLLFAIFMIADRTFIRIETAEKSVISASLMTESIDNIMLEDQEIVNDDSIHLFAKNAISRIFNFNPGQASDHVNSEEIKRLFISDEYHQMFADQFISWSNFEFQLNNISIKESIIRNAELTRSPGLAGGSRLWQLDARLPVLNRAVGGTSLNELTVEVYLVYLGHRGGLGIYGIRLR